MSEAGAYPLGDTIESLRTRLADEESRCRELMSQVERLIHRAKEAEAKNEELVAAIEKVEAERPLYAEDEIAKFWGKVAKGPACWEWQGHRVPKGYGYAFIGGKSRRAPRVAWEITSGAIPNGLQILHLCDNAPCVRPGHLALGTNTANILMMRQKALGLGKVSHCAKGHAVEGENAYLSKGRYRCQICKRELKAKWDKEHPGRQRPK